jgi:MtfA peptidase
MFEAFRRWKRRRIIERAELDPVLWQRTLAQLPFLAGLSAEENERLRQTAILFLHNKSIHGAGGLELDAAMPLLIAVQACILILNLDIEYYEGWVEVIVYPDEFVPKVEYVDEDGVVHTDLAPRAGEAWLQGPVILSWADVAPRADGDGVNVVIHEFAHKLDMRNGAANGCPPLPPEMPPHVWKKTMMAAYGHFQMRVESGERTAIDPYAAESPAEFFAVLSEVFFVEPALLRHEYVAVYQQFARFYRQEPAARTELLLEE